MVKRVTVIAPDISGFSGTKSYVENVILGLEENNVEFELKYVSKKEFSLGGKPYFGILTQSLLSKFVRASTPVVHSLSPELVTRQTNIVTIHDVIPYTQPELYMKNAYDKFAYGLAFNHALNVDHILVSTEFGKKQLMKIGKFENSTIHVLRHSIRLNDFFPDPEPLFPKDTINVVMLSDFNPRKRIDVIVDSLNGDSEISFYHIGPKQGWESNYERIIAMAKNSKNIKFLGPQPTEMVRKYLSSADLFVYLSDEEGFGYPVLEAMACGTNTLINRIPVFEELFSDISSFCELGSFSRDDILRAVDNKKSRELLKKFVESFSTKEMGRELSNLYDSV